MKIFLIVLVIFAGLIAFISFFFSDLGTAANDPVTRSQRQASLDDWTQVLRQSDIGDGERAALANKLENEAVIFRPDKIGIVPIRGSSTDVSSPIRVVCLLPNDAQISKFWEEKVDSSPAVYNESLNAVVLNPLPQNKEAAISALEEALDYALTAQK